jgi:hypothetical protein
VEKALWDEIGGVEGKLRELAGARAESLKGKVLERFPLVAFWLNEKRPGRRFLVSRSRYKLCDVAINNKIYHNAKVRYRGAHTYRNGIKNDCGP